MTDAGTAPATQRPTPHQADVAARIAADFGVSQSLRDLGESVLRQYFGNDMSRRDDEHLPQSWHLDQGKSALT